MKKKVVITLVIGNTAFIVLVLLWVVFHWRWLLAIPPILFLNYLFYLIMTSNASNINESYVETISTDKVINGINVLRYAAAALALISIFTTASGLSSFVFTGGTKTSYVLAGFASFAIQSILLVFSLLFFHIRLKLKSITSLSDGFKEVVLFMAVLLFTLSILASSSFSYVFIANNTYEKMYAKNSNITIEHFLRDETKSLREVNEIIGAVVREDVEKKIDDLQGKMKGKKIAVRQNNETQSESTEEVTKEGPFFPETDYKRLRDANKGFESDYDLVYAAFQRDYDVYSNAFDKYTVAIEVLNKEDSYDLNLLENNLEELKNQRTYLESTIELIDNHTTRPINDGMANYRDTEKNILSDLKTHITTLIDDYEKLVQGFASEADTINKIREILYVSRWQEDINEAELTTIYQSLIQIITDEAETTQNADNSDYLKDLNDFLTSFSDFIKYVSLDKKLKDFSEEKLSLTYYIKTSVEEDANLLGNANNSKTIKIVNETEWRQARKNDFIDLCDCINTLPDLSSYVASGELGEEKRDILKNYRPSDILMHAYTMNRDLLEDISDFEKAINYFKYDFRLMAILSLALALFFDVVSSLTGGFMFAATFLKSRPDAKVGTKESESKGVEEE